MKNDRPLNALTLIPFKKLAQINPRCLLIDKQFSDARISFFFSRRLLFWKFRFFSGASIFDPFAIIPFLCVCGKQERDSTEWIRARARSTR